VRWHPVCQYLATGSSDHSVRLWDVASGQCVRIFLGHRAPVRGPAHASLQPAALCLLE
jgi:transcription initiation factor TFIID subunit 5